VAVRATRPLTPPIGRDRRRAVLPGGCAKAQLERASVHQRDAVNDRAASPQTSDRGELCGRRLDKRLVAAGKSESRRQPPPPATGQAHDEMRP
jgi:hypothetical protein